MDLMVVRVPVVSFRHATRTRVGPPAIRPLRTSPRRDVFRAGGARGDGRPRLPRVLDGLLRGPIGPTGPSGPRSRDRAVLQLRTRASGQSPSRGVGNRGATDCVAGARSLSSGRVTA